MEILEGLVGILVSVSFFAAILFSAIIILLQIDNLYRLTVKTS